MARRGFICAGCWTSDRIKFIDAWPAEEELASIVSTDRQGGGSAHNVGVDLRRLDPSMPVQGMGLLGLDSDGDFLYEQARAHGIDTRQLHRTASATTAYTDVYTVVASGRRTFFHHPGANDELSPTHFDFSNTQARVLHLGLLGVHRILDGPGIDGDANGWVSVLRRARQAGLHCNIELVSIDAERNRALCLPCLPWLDSLIVNDQEIGALAGIATLEAGKALPLRCAEAAQHVLQMGAMQQVVVHYPAGAVCVDRRVEPVFSDAVPIPSSQVVGSVGAGDAFAAGMLYALHEGWPTVRGLALAHAAAAASLRAADTVGSVEPIEACLAFAAACRAGAKAVPDAR